MSALARERAVVKMQATGNTFVVLDERVPQFETYSELARRLCDPAGGLDADGLLVIATHPQADAAMRIFNADGSEAETCGNGLRCIVRYLTERDGRDRYTLAVATRLAGASVRRREPFEAAIGMGRVSFPANACEETIVVGGRTWAYVAVSAGNPHAVIFVEDPGQIDLERLGSEICGDARFSLGTNVHLASVVSRSRLRVRHYERGVGLTDSCGSGAVACALAAIRTRGVRAPVDVEVPGGTLRVELQPGGEAVLAGPAETVFERTLAV